MKRYLSKLKWNRFLRGLCKRTTALLLVLVMVLQYMPYAYAESTEGPTDGYTKVGGDSGMASYSSPLYIYNFMYYSSNENTVAVGSAGFSLEGTSNVDIFIGDYSDPNNLSTNPTAHNINTRLQELNTDKTITINPVNAGTYVVDMSVPAASSVGNLVLNANAKLNLNVSSSLTLGTLTLGEGSTLNLTIESGATLTIGTVTGNGSINVNGSGTLNVTSVNIGMFAAANTNINVGTLLHAESAITLTEATVDGAGTAKVTSNGNITVSGGTLRNLVFFGYETANLGIRTINLQSVSTVTGVQILGISENAAGTRVRIEGADSISNLGTTTFVSDFNLTYSHNGTLLPYEIDAYRAVYTSGKLERIAYLIKNDHSLIPANTVLPLFAEDGYTFNGWSIDNSEVLYTALVNESGAFVIGTAKDLSLTTSVTANAVSVIFDHGFIPDAYSHECDKGQEWILPDASVAVGSTITLPQEIYRVGYTFNGWKIATSADQRVLSTEVQSHTISYSDLQLNENGQLVLRLEAQWTARTYTFRFSLAGSTVSLEHVLISFDNGANWTSIQQMNGNQYFTWHADGPYIAFQGILYGESFSEYFTRIGCQMPILQDARDASIAQNFVAWQTTGGNIAEIGSVFEYSAAGILDNRQAGTALNEYSDYLGSNPMTFLAAWGSMNFHLSIANVAGWEVLINSQLQTVGSNGYQIETVAGAEISLRIEVTNASGFSGWSFIDAAGNHIYPVEQPYHVGEQYLYYNFTMPKSNVTGTYHAASSGTTYIDLSKSSITMEDNVVYNNIGRNGFWYNALIDDYSPLFAVQGNQRKAMTELNTNDAVTYFYTLTEDVIYVTSNNIETTNKLTLIDAITVYLKDCRLVASTEYTTDFVGRKWKDKVLQSRNSSGNSGVNDIFAAVDMTPYGNIIINNETNPKYTVTFYVEGENTVNSIVPSSFRTGNDYISTISIDGSISGILNLGSIIGNFAVNFKRLTLNELSGSSSEYLTYLVGDNEGDGAIAIFSCIINAPTKYLYTWRGNIQYRETTDATFGNTHHYGQTLMYNSAKLHIMEDMIGVYDSVVMSGDTSIIIEGNLRKYYDHRTAVPIINTTGYLIVKGNRCQISGVQLKKGTIIANAVSPTNRITVTGGTIITNQIINTPGGFAGNYSDYSSSSWVDANGDYIEGRKPTSAGTLVTMNGDDSPFQTYAQTEPLATIYKFSEKAKVYLLGHYKVNGTSYDYTVKATDEDNPLKAIIDVVLNGGALTDEYLQAAVTAQAGKYIDTIPECVMIGNSNYTKGVDTAGRFRSVEISGEAQIYAAGNLTFFNDTTISGTPVIQAAGSLTSKRDLIITGGTITASSVGNRNQWNLKYKEDDGVDRWQKTEISGGILKVDALGNLNTNDRTTLVISNNPTIQSRIQGQEVSVYQDVLVSYIYDESIVIEDNPKEDNLRLTGKWINSYSDMTIDEKIFPTASGISWAMQSLTGPIVTKADSTGHLDNPEQTAAYLLVKLPLFAIKSEYTVTVKALDYSARYGEVSLALDDSLPINRGAEVMLTIDSAAVGKSIICYRDTNGNLYNVLPTISEDGTQLSFIMPAANVEVYVADEFSLDLYAHSIILTDYGFIAEKEKTRESSVFSYQGNIRIWQSVTSTVAGTEKSTDNKIRVTGEIEGRKITLGQLNQWVVGDYGIEIENGVTGEFLIDGSGGKTNISSVHVPEFASVSFTGVHTRDGIYFNKYSTYDSKQKRIGSLDGKAGNVTLRNLTIFGSTTASTSTGTLISQNSINLNNKVIFDNIEFDSPWVVSSASDLTRNMLNVEIRNSKIELEGAKSYTTSAFYTCETLEIINSEVSYKDVGATYSVGTMFIPYSADSRIILDSSHLTFSYRNSTETTAYFEYIGGTPWNMTLRNGAELTAESRFQVGQLNLENGSVTVTPTSGSDAYLLCNDIQIAEGSVEADYIILSAFTKAIEYSKSYTEDMFNLWASQASSSNRVETGNLTMNGGSITANKFIGGAYGATLNINGGILNSPAVGTGTSIFGFVCIIPPETEQAVYQYAIRPADASSTVNINGGTVNISNGGYLGGHNGIVKVTGGSVNLGTGAVLGLTDTQRSDAENDATSHGQNPADMIHVSVEISGGKVETASDANILTPYGSTVISGEATAVKANNILAEYGSVDIKQAKGSYDIETEYSNPPEAGVHVNDRLAAQSIFVGEGAVVFAESVKSEIPSAAEGGFKIDEGNGTRVYTYAYGVTGDGADENSLQVIETDGAAKNIFCLVRTVPIRYVLNGDQIDPAINAVDNPSSYNQAASGTVDLHDPTRHGFEFAGWYLDADFTGDKVTQLQMAFTAPVTLYAKWIPKKVEFQIVLDENSGAGTVSTAVNGAASDLGTYDAANKTFTYHTITLDYRTQLQGGTGIRLVDLSLPMYEILVLEVAETENYEGQTQQISTSTIIDGAMFDAYTKNERPFKLHVKSVQKTRAKIVFNLNLENALPKDAAFTSDATDEKTNVTRESYVDYGSPITIGKGFVDSNGQFIEAIAPGYNFKGWKTLDGTMLSDVNTYIVTKETKTQYYAVWEPKRYQLQFDAGEGAVVTASAELNDSAVQTLTGSVLYDSVVQGSLTWSSDAATHSLPVAWKSGFKFSHWEVNGTKISHMTKLNLSTFSTLDITKGDTAEVALTIQAVYTPVTVTYVTNGGKWQTNVYGKAGTSETVTIENPVWGEALAGYVSNAVSGTGYNLISLQTINEKNYAVYSTTGVQYNTTNHYVPNDYRNTLLKKGYTFYGWFTTPEDAVNASADPNYSTNVAVTTPEYEDITVYAAWHANSYSLQLNAKDADYSYQYTKFHNDYLITDGAAAAGTAPIVNVAVGQSLTTDGTVNVTAWPERNDDNENLWYAYNSELDGTSLDEQSKRFLLGFSFAPFDPGTSETTNTTGRKQYEKYAAYVTNLINDKVLFTKGQSQFFIPEDYDYKDIWQSTDVADFPEGSTIQMYAVYRERSLVFIEYYKDVDGTTVEIEKAAYPYQTYVDYPAEYLHEDSKTQIERKGYSLTNWYFIEPSINENRKYPTNSESYLANLDTIKQMAEQEGSYDIKVYTVYVARATINDVILEGDGSAYGTSEASYIVRTLPGSIQAGPMKYEIAFGDGASTLNLVTKEQLQEQLYTSAITNGGTADNTAAITVTFTSPDGKTVHTEELTGTSGTFKQTTVVSGGWRVRFDLYTSKVVTSNECYTFDLTFNFTDTSLTNQQILFDDMKVQMVPSKYTVIYDANLPTNDSQLQIEYNGFTQNEEGKYTRAEVLGYGSPLLGIVPTLEGYKEADNKWLVTAGTAKDTKIDLGSNLNLAVSENDRGKIYLQADWEVLKYWLEVEAAVLEGWDVTYTPLDGTKTTYTEKVQIPYHSTVEFTKKADGTVPDQFVQLDWYTPETASVLETSTLNLLETKYNILMDARDLKASYENLRTLYLEDGDITITESGYTHKGESVAWSGKYLILMDKDNNTDNTTTANRLTLNGNLSGREICLGNLNISSDDSIRLGENATAELDVYADAASTLNVKNIYVPKTAALTMQMPAGETTKGSVVLTPSVGYAGIGGNPTTAANGTITLNGLNVDLSMLPSNSGSASGIGAATPEAEGNAIILKNCAVTASQTETAAALYKGSWIGGRGVTAVTLESSALDQKSDSATPVGSYAVSAKCVTITGSHIGESGPVGGLIYAKDELSVSNSTVIQKMIKPLDQPPFGSDGTIMINTSTVTVNTDNTTWPGLNEGILYSGKMFINDVQSNVQIHKHQLLETGNGDIVITGESCTQSGQTYSGIERYVLLGNKNTATSTLTATTDAEVMLDPLSEDVQLAGMNYTGKLTVTGAAKAAANVVGVTDTKLVLTGDLTGKGNLTLKDITAEAVNNKIGSQGAVDETDTPTTVAITGKSKITANTVGALGTYDETFTFVTVADTAAVNAALVQDHYRIEYRILYQNEDNSYDTSHLDKIYRSTQVTDEDGTIVETSVGDSVPKAPEPDTNFRAWYYKAGSERFALSTDTETVPGYAGNKILHSALIEEAESEELSDGTSKLILYAGMAVSGKVTVEEGRLFTTTKFVTEQETVTIPANASFTALFSLDEADTTTGEYQFAFEQALPKGTKLTLVSCGTIPIYAFYIAEGEVTTVSLGEFIQMGTTDTSAALPEVNAKTGKRELLLAFDFEEAAEVDSNTVTFNFVIDSYKNEIAVFTYELTEVNNGSVTAAASTVTAAFPTNSVYEGKTYALIAEITGVSVPYEAEMKLGTENGILFDGNKFLFKHVTEAAQNVVVDGIYGNFKVQWKLVVDEEDTNVLKTILAESGEVSYNRTKPEAPWMTFELASVNGSTQGTSSRALTLGTAYTVVFEFETNQTEAAAIAEKQGDTLAAFAATEQIQCVVGSISETDGIARGTVTVTFPAALEKGVYRIGASLNGNHFEDCDNVYYTFTVN